MNGCIVIATGAAIALGLVLVTAAIHKLRAPRAMTRLIERHAAMPASVVSLLPVPLALLELVTGITLALNLHRGAASVAAALLLLYTLAIALSLARGGAGEDCGCGGIAGSVPVGAGLLARNAVLVALAVALALLPAHPAPEILEWFAAIALALVALASFVAVNFALARETLLRDD